jgi:hypothetical protein
VDWFLERILVSERYTVSRRELETYWTIEDVLSAHQVLDAIDEAHERARIKAERKHHRGPS